MRVYREGFELKAKKATLTSRKGREEFDKIKAVGAVYLKRWDELRQEFVEAFGDVAEYDVVSEKIVVTGKRR